MADGDRNQMIGATAARERGIVRTSVVGIASNVVLSVFKIFVGLMSNSIAIVLDAVNNLSDAASSLITIIGTKLAGKQADYKHPFGYGRLEYVTTIVIAALVLWAGITSLKESVIQIFVPEASSYTVVSLLIVFVAVLVKFALGAYVKKRGQELESDSLIASGTDASMDAILSTSTLVAALITVLAHISIEAYVAAVISLFIIKAGADILREAIGKILGERVDGSLADEIKETINQIDGVRGAYDLALNDYGPNRLTGSVHVEVADTMCAREIDEMTRTIQETIYKKFGVTISTVGIYSSNQNDVVSRVMRKEIEQIVYSFSDVIELHGFYVDEREHAVRFDVVIDYRSKNREQEIQEIRSRVAARYPEFHFDIVLDADISNSK